MGVYIKGMEMPKGCYDCRLKMNCYECEGLDCFCLPLFRNIGNSTIRDNGLPKDKREADCPLVPVPPHGRLGDLDALEEKAIKRSTSGVCVNVLNRVISAFDIETAPTVIDAEET